MKKYSTIGCCGIDCGLCPRYYTDGSSACPGCDGIDFRLKHPSCGFVTCCTGKHRLEVCSDCDEYPCRRFEPEKSGFDSFVTHRKVFDNHEAIIKNGIAKFIELQETRISILRDFINNYDDGRSKSFFCLACTLLPMQVLIDENNSIETIRNTRPVKELNTLLKERLISEADRLNIELKLRKKTG